MMNKEKSDNFLDKIVPAVVVAIPFLLVIAYLANSKGSFQTASAPSAAPVQNTSETQTSGSATLTLDDPLGLPQMVTTGEIVPFSFTVTNSGSTDANFSYKVSVQWNSGEEDVIDENSVSLSAGASKDISESLKFETTPATAQILIQIQGSQQSLSFTLPRT